MARAVIVSAYVVGPSPEAAKGSTYADRFSVLEPLEIAGTYPTIREGLTAVRRYVRQHGYVKQAKRMPKLLVTFALYDGESGMVAWIG